MKTDHEIWCLLWWSLELIYGCPHWSKWEFSTHCLCQKSCQNCNKKFVFRFKEITNNHRNLGMLLCILSPRLRLKHLRHSEVRIVKILQVLLDPFNPILWPHRPVYPHREKKQPHTCIMYISSFVIFCKWTWVHLCWTNSFLHYLYITKFETQEKKTQWILSEIKYSNKNNEHIGATEPIHTFLWEHCSHKKRLNQNQLYPSVAASEKTTSNVKHPL